MLTTTFAYLASDDYDLVVAILLGNCSPGTDRNGLHHRLVLAVVRQPALAAAFAAHIPMRWAARKVRYGDFNRVKLSVASAQRT